MLFYFKDFENLYLKDTFTGNAQSKLNTKFDGTRDSWIYFFEIKKIKQINLIVSGNILFKKIMNK